MTTLQQPAPTFDDVWRTIQELALLNKETERLMKEGSAEAERRFQETERLMKEGAAESKRRFQETERLRTYALMAITNGVSSWCGCFWCGIVRNANIKTPPNSQMYLADIHGFSDE